MVKGTSAILIYMLRGVDKLTTPHCKITTAIQKQNGHKKIVNLLFFSTVLFHPHVSISYSTQVQESGDDAQRYKYFDLHCWGIDPRPEGNGSHFLSRTRAARGPSPASGLSYHMYYRKLSAIT